jgi:hypothetical protein
MNQSSEGLEALWSFEETTRFDTVGEDSEEVLDSVRKLLPFVEEDLGL